MSAEQNQEEITCDFDHMCPNFKSLVDQNDQLLTDLKEAMAALEFYGAEENWDNPFANVGQTINKEDLECSPILKFSKMVAGRRARTALTNLRKRHGGL